MSSTIIKSILALSMPTITPHSTVPYGGKDVLRLLSVQTSSTEAVTSPDLADMQQDLFFDGLSILLRSRAVRMQGLGMSSATTAELRDPSQPPHIVEGAEGHDCVRMEEELKQLRAAGSCRLSSKLTWIVAQKTRIIL